MWNFCLNWIVPVSNVGPFLLHAKNNEEQTCVDKWTCTLWKVNNFPVCAAFKWLFGDLPLGLFKCVYFWHFNSWCLYTCRFPTTTKISHYWCVWGHNTLNHSNFLIRYYLVFSRHKCSMQQQKILSIYIMRWNLSSKHFNSLRFQFDGPFLIKPSMHSGSKRLISNNSVAFQVVVLKENRFYFRPPEMHKHNLSIPFENTE